MSGLAQAPRRRPELVLMVATLLWASTFVVTKDVVASAPPLAYLALRFSLATLLLGLAFWRKLSLDRRLLRDGGLLGLLLAVGLLLQVIGQTTTTASKSAFITSLNTPLTPLLALGLYRTRPSLLQQIGVALASLGLLLLTYPEGGGAFNRGDLYTLACAFVYALVIVETPRRAGRHHVGALTTVQVGVSAIAFSLAWAVAHLVIARSGPGLPELLRLEARPLPQSARVVAEVLYLATVCTVGTFLLQTWAMARMSATHAAIVFALEPVLATAMAVAVLGAAEWPGARGALGAALVLSAVVVSELRRR